MAREERRAYDGVVTLVKPSERNLRMIANALEQTFRSGRRGEPDRFACLLCGWRYLFGDRFGTTELKVLIDHAATHRRCDVCGQRSGNTRPYYSPALDRHYTLCPGCHPFNRK